MKNDYDYNILGYHFIMIKTPTFRKRVKYAVGQVTKRLEVSFFRVGLGLNIGIFEVF